MGSLLACYFLTVNFGLSLSPCFSLMSSFSLGLGPGFSLTCGLLARSFLTGSFSLGFGLGFSLSGSVSLSFGLRFRLTSRFSLGPGLGFSLARSFIYNIYNILSSRIQKKFIQKLKTGLEKNNAEKKSGPLALGPKSYERSYSRSSYS
jgi:hypothetical protein